VTARDQANKELRRAD